MFIIGLKILSTTQHKKVKFTKSKIFLSTNKENNQIWSLSYIAYVAEVETCIFSQLSR